MGIISFTKSRDLSVGAELELQLVNPITFDLTPIAKDLIRSIHRSHFQDYIKPEITQSMIEVNSSCHQYTVDIHDELQVVCDFLNTQAATLDALISGGGTHPFQNWSSRKIFPTTRFKNISRLYGYLAKRFTVFALHVHIGCKNAEKAIFLTHLLNRYVPHFIAMSASSPFYQGVCTGYHSTRTSVVNGFPLSGVIPYVTSWKAFSQYYQKMQRLKVIESMKDFYWDIRPKPEFGTVEIRICDMPLTLTKVAALIGYIQTLARYLLVEKPYKLTEDLYLVYNYNRFQASRYGYDGDFIDPYTKRHLPIYNDILRTLKHLKPHAAALGNEAYLKQWRKWIKQKHNDAKQLKMLYSRYGNFEDVVNKQCNIWMNDIS